MKQKLLHFAAILAALLTLRPRGVTLANIAEGTHLSSQGITYEADGAITERNLLVKRGSASNRIALCGDAFSHPIPLVRDPNDCRQQRYPRDFERTDRREKQDKPNQKNDRREFSVSIGKRENHPDNPRA